MSLTRLGHRSTSAPACEIARKGFPYVATLSLLLAGLLLFSPTTSFAGGSSLNTVIVINQNSTNSCELGNYYAEARGIGPDNVLRITWAGGNISWLDADFTNALLNPLLAMLSSRQLTNQIDYVVLSMDIPFTTMKGTNANSTTSALFYGLKGANGAASSYALSEAAFRSEMPSSSAGYPFLTTMLTGESLAEAESMIDQGVAGDGTLPTPPIFLEKTTDTSRNSRYSEFDLAIFNANILGRGTLVRTNTDNPAIGGPLMGLETGLASFTVASNEFAPGAMADSLTSFGGIIFGPNGGQTTLLSFIAAGASGSFGTVAEPFGNVPDFPNAMNYFYQARGFSLAESYYQSVKNPFLGLIVGEPLSAPFAQPGRSKWLGAVSNAVLSGICVLSNSAAGGHPLQRMDLFIDGKYFQTVTNVGPAAGNVLNLNIEGFPISYVVPSNSTIGGVVTGLVANINTPSLTNLTKVVAFPFGDRIELRDLNTNYLNDPFYFADTSATGATAPLYRVDYLPFPERPQFDEMFMNSATGYDLRVETAPGVPCVVEASTNFVDWSPIATNALGGMNEIIDTDARLYPQRFYRLISPDAAPVLSLTLSNAPGATLHVWAPTTLPYVIQQSSDLRQWTSVLTNTAGTNMDFFDPWSPGVSARFYRAMTLVPMLSAATVTTTTNKSSGGQVVSVSKPARAYTLKTSTNGIVWTYVSTNLSLTEGQISAGSDIGSATMLSTFINAAQSTFVGSPAHGWRAESVSSATQQAQAGSWLQLTVIKTNGSVYSVGVTNGTGTTPLSNLAMQLTNSVGAAPELQGAAGVFIDDFQVSGVDGSVFFNVYARSPGFPAAAVRVKLSASNDLSFTGGTWPLTSNVSDLQARNHLYLTTGITPLTGTVALDTTQLPDGFHDLTMVGYEGSSVATQCRSTIPVQIHNTGLSASIALLDLTNNAPVAGTYRIQVTANTNTVSELSVFTTGGLLATVTNQSSATFTIDGAFLCAGLHPFYALVQTSDGLQYRTETKYARLVNSP